MTGFKLALRRLGLRTRQALASPGKPRQAQASQLITNRKKNPDSNLYIPVMVLECLEIE